LVLLRPWKYLVIPATHSQCGERRDGVAGKQSAIQVNAFQFQPRVQRASSRSASFSIELFALSWSLIVSHICVDVLTAACHGR